MKRVRTPGLLLILAAALPISGCGAKSHEKGHAASATTQPAPPMPDTTPIEALRTPAGMVLKLGEERTPPPGAVPTPSPSR